MLQKTLKKALLLSLTSMFAPSSVLLAEAPEQSLFASSGDSVAEGGPSGGARCDGSCRSSRITARHIENKGIGYNTGYTTLEAFFAAPVDFWSVMPFVDLRGHVFDDGHWAANGGLGLRSLVKNRIYGAYVYYDFRDTKRKSYNQVSFGVETLGTFWDLRVNGYVVAGDRKSHPYDTQFSQFKGNSIYYTQKFQYALSGGNAEVGFYPLKMCDIDLYTGIGPYYLKGPVNGAVWGGQARAKFTWKDYVGAEVSYSYDHIFKNIVQGQVFFSYPFGPKRKARGGNLLCQRMVEPVGKSEIIPVTTKKSEKPAINPATGQPYSIFFVNNLSHSAGTYESPFSTLAAAESASQQNDIIYVYPGDLTSTGLSDGIMLKNGQQLLGATIDHGLMTTAGQITLTAQASGSNTPLLSNGAGSVVTLASNNVVSGLYIQNTAGMGIVASGSDNVTLTQNYIQGNSLTYNGIELDNVTGTVTASSNTIISQESCVYIHNSNSISNASYLFTNNTFHTEGGSYDFKVAYTEGSNNYFLSSGNNLYASTAAAINIVCSNTAVNTPHVFDVTGCNIGTDQDRAIELVLNNDSLAQLNVNNSVINSVNGIYAITNNQSNLMANISNNAFHSYEHAFQPEPHNSSLISVMFANNSISCYQYPIYTNLADSASLIGTIENNSIDALYHGIYTNALDSSNFAVDINNNTINSAYDHIETTSSDSSTYAGNVIGNTFIGHDNDDTIFWDMSTSGTVSCAIKNNVFTGNFSALDLSNSGTGTIVLDISNNTIQNSSSTGIAIANSGTNFGIAITKNTFQGFETNAVNISNSGGDACLTFNDNTSNPYPNAYVIDVTGGTFNLVTPQGNLGQLETAGVTAVSQCP